MILYAIIGWAFRLIIMDVMKAGKNVTNWEFLNNSPHHLHNSDFYLNFEFQSTFK